MNQLNLHSDDGTDLLRRRIRSGLWLVLIANFLFAIADLKWQPHALGWLFLIKAVGVGLTAVLLHATGRWSSRGAAQGIAFVGIAVAVAMTAGSGALIQDPVTTPILCTAVVLGTATLLPWGAFPQTVAVVLASAGMLAHAFALPGQGPLSGYPAVGLIIAFGVSIFAAREMQGYRELIAAEKIEREETARQLLDSRERYRELVEHANDAIFTHDLDGNFTSFNHAAEKVSGYSREEALGMNVAQLLLPEDLAEVRGLLERVRERPGELVAGGIELKPVERRIRTKDGRIVVLEVSSQLLFQDGKPVVVEGIARDVTERRESDLALRDSEARLRDVASHVPGIVYRFHVKPDGSFSFPLVIDSPYLAAIGLTADELQRDPAAAFRRIVPEDVGTVWAAIAEMPEIEQARPADFRVFSETGEVRWFRASSALERMPDGGILSTGILTDFTERRRAEEAAMRLAAIVESSDDAIIAMTLEGTVLTWNAGAERVYGYAAAEVVGGPVSVLLPPDRPEEVRGILERIRAGERIDHFETVRQRKDGSEIHVSLTVSPVKDAAGRVVGASTIARDIGERIRMEEALRAVRDELERRVEERTRELTASNELLRREIGDRERIEQELIAAREVALQSSSQFAAVLQSVGEAIISIYPTGTIVMVNREVEKIFGYKPDELVGQRLQVLMPERYRMNHVEGLERYMRTHESHLLDHRVEIEGLRKDGSVFPIEICVVETRVGQRILFTAAVRDISERKRVEADLQRAKELAEEANRAKSEFLANVSHEIRTPMNAVVGMTGLMLDTELNPDQREYAETIRSAGGTLLTLINDLLDFSKMESGRLELETQPFDLRSCLEDALDLLAPRAAEKGLELAYFLGENAPETLIGDVGRLRQVLVNLLGNAVRFTHAGEVVVTADATPLRGSAENHETLPAVRAPQLYEIHFAVRDTGVGIPRERFNRLFQSFSQVDTSSTRRHGGTGLGLAISKRLAELMSGNIWVESEVGKGSTFHFTIHAPGAPAESRPSLRGRQPSLLGRRALIVEQHPTHRRVLVEQVESWGMAARAASWGMEALDWIRRGEPFDLAVLDMHNPDLEGAALAAEIRAYRDADQLPLVMLTSLGRWQDDRAEMAGRPGSEFVAFLTKPIKSTELYDILMDLFGEPRPDLVRNPVRPSIPRLADRLPMRILVAEDNEVNQRVVLRILSRMGYRADVAANGLEVIQALRRQPYDVVLMDVQMPEMDGLQATRRICELWAAEERPRIIAMTAHAMQGDRERCLAAGMQDYVSKPVQIEELQMALERCGSGDGTIAVRRGDAVDASILARLRNGQEPDEPDLVAELIEIFLEHTPSGLAAIREAVATRDSAALNQAGHRLKSGSAQLGARRMSALCAQLEQMGRNGQLDGTEALVVELEAEFERVRDELEAERERAIGPMSSVGS